MMKIGILGCGGMGITHMLSLKALASSYDIAVTAVADLREERQRKAADIWPEAVFYKEGMDLLDKEDIHMAVICLPSYLHTVFAVRAMEKGLPVFLEKPVCLSEKDCELLWEVQERTKSKVLVGQVVRMMEEYQYLKELTVNKTYGNLRSLSMRRLSGLVDWGYENWFRDMERSGSVVLDLHIHDADFLRYLLGEPEQVQITARKNAQGMPEQIMAQYRFGEVIASAEAVWDNPKGFPFEAGYRACFDYGTVIFNSNGEHKIVEYGPDGQGKFPTLIPEYEAVDDSAGINISQVGPYYTEMKYFLDCLIQDREIAVLPLKEGVASVRLCLRELQEALK